MYQDNYNFSNEELLELAYILDYLGHPKLLEILILIKDKGLEKELNPKIIKRYKDIVFQERLHETFVYYNLIGPLKWLKGMNHMYNWNKSREICADRGNLETLKYLGVSIHPSALDKMNLLARAVENNHLDVAKYLIKNGAKNDNNILVEAILNRNLEMVKCLIKSRSSGFSKKANYYILILTVRHGNFQIFRWVLEFLDVQIDDDQVLIAAIQYEQLKIIEWLVENSKCERDKVSFLAMMYNSLSVIKYLVENNLLTKDEINQALIYSVDEGCLEIVKYLIKKGLNGSAANVNVQNGAVFELANGDGDLKILECLTQASIVR